MKRTMNSSTKYGQTWLEARRRAQRDFLWFGGSVLGYPHLYPRLHEQMVAFWVRKARHKLGMWPRGYFKSTVLSIIGPLWNVIRYLPDDVVIPPVIPFQFLLASERGENAEKYLHAINQHVTSNPTFRYLFPEIQAGTPWNHKVRNLKRSFDPTLKEFTFESAGLNSDPTSTHYTDIIGDDLTGFSNYETPEGRDSVERWWTATNPLLMPDGRRVLVMTRWHDDDIAGRVIAENPNLPITEQYHIENHGCYEWYETQDEHGSSTFPTVWPDDKLRAERIHQGDERFSSWMLNDPKAPETRYFDWEKVAYWTKDDEFDKALSQMTKVMIVDPANGLEAHHDFSGIVIVGCQGNQRWVLKPHKGRWSWLDLIAQVKSLCRSYRVSRLGVEAVAQGSAIIEFFMAEYRKGGMPYPERLHPQHNVKGSKTERVRGLIPYVHSGQILFHREQTELLDQIRDYPAVSHDDLVDPLAYLPVIMPFLGEGHVRRGYTEGRPELHPGDKVLAYEPDDRRYQVSASAQYWETI